MYINFHDHKFPKSYYFLSQIVPVVVANYNAAISQQKKKTWQEDKKATKETCRMRQNTAVKLNISLRCVGVLI